MSYKRDVIMQIKDEERMKKMSKVLVKKLEKMTQEQREEFIEKLTKKITIIDAELKDLRCKEGKISERNLFKRLSEDQASAIICANVVVLGLSCGFISLALLPVDLTILGAAAVVGGAIVGGGTGILSCIMAENKVISSFIANIKEKFIDLKHSKLIKNKEDIQQQLEKAQEFSK